MYLHTLHECAASYSAFHMQYCFPVTEVTAIAGRQAESATDQTALKQYSPRTPTVLQVSSTTATTTAMTILSADMTKGRLGSFNIIITKLGSF